MTTVRLHHLGEQHAGQASCRTVHPAELCRRMELCGSQIGHEGDVCGGNQAQMRIVVTA